MRRTLLLSVIATLAIAAPAEAQLTTTASPGTAGKAANVTFNINGLEPPINGQLPTSLALTASGFKLNTNAAPRRCTHQQATIVPAECPVSSQIGSGNLNIGIFLNGSLLRNQNFSFKIYLAHGSGVYLVAQIEGGRLAPGTLSSVGGVTLSFNPLPHPDQIVSNLHFTLNSITVKLGGSRTVVTRHKKTVTVKVNGKVVKRTKVVTTKKRYNLLTAPTSCAGGWPASLTLGLADGPATAPAAIACKA